MGTRRHIRHRAVIEVEEAPRRRGCLPGCGCLPMVGLVILLLLAPPPARRFSTLARLGACRDHAARHVVSGRHLSMNSELDFRPKNILK